MDSPLRDMSKKESEWGQKVNELIAYAVNGECGGRTVDDCKKELIDSISQAVSNRENEIAEEVQNIIEKFKKATNVGDDWYSCIELFSSAFSEAVDKSKTINLSDHKCGGELCIVCGYREKIKKIEWKSDFYQKFCLGSDMKEVESFISNLLSTREKEIAEEVERKIYDPSSDEWTEYADGHDDALKDVLQIIKH